MTREQAKQTLSVYRPDAADANDAEFAEALAFARQDAELAAWFERHCAVQQVLRTRFRQIAVPEGFKEQIISEHRSSLARERWRRPVALAAAVVATAALVTVASLWLRSNAGPKEDANFATYRSRMVGAVLRQYTMTLETNDPDQIRAHLAQQQAPADYRLTKALEQTVSTGCGVLRWQDQPVSMVCFRSGKPLPPGTTTDLFLFIVDRSALSDGPTATAPQIANVNKLVTASWTQGQKVYVLATEGNEESIRRYLD